VVLNKRGPEMLKKKTLEGETKVENGSNPDPLLTVKNKMENGSNPDP
jgi:hypothetical protein